MEIARALIHRPEVLLLDEATVGLDFKSRQDIVAHVHELAAGGLTVLWATHLVDEIHDSDDVVVLHRGHVLAHDTAAELRKGRPLADVFIEMTATGETA